MEEELREAFGKVIQRGQKDGAGIGMEVSYDIRVVKENPYIAGEWQIVVRRIK